jgi:hypothetical protein
MEGPDKISAGTGGMKKIDGSGAERAGPENDAVTRRQASQ